MRIKSGVRLHGMRPEILLAAMVADEVYREYDVDGITITSCIDGKHKTGSKHYAGSAIDIRTWTLEQANQPKAVATLKERLGDDYDVVLETDHIHIEFDPKKEL